MSVAEIPADRETYHLLSLAGGGFLGLYTVKVLEMLEARAGIPLARHFDLLAGSSIGGLLALALAFELPMARISQLFCQRGPEVFSKRALPANAVTKLLDLSRSVLGPKYTGQALREALQAEFGDLRLGDAIHPVVVTAVDVGNCSTKIFKTPHGNASLGDSNLRAVDVAMAACAAPAYFPAVRVARTLYADGGLFAVAPDQVAMHELEHYVGIDPARMAMLAIGTAARRYRPEADIAEDAGAVGWLSDGRLIMTLISAQQQHVKAMMQDRLGERYLHLDADWPVDGGLGLDVATPETIRRLTNLAKQSLSTVPDSQLVRFFSHLGAGPD